MPYSFANGLVAKLEIWPNMARTIPHTMEFSGRQIDMSYCYVVVFLFIVFFVIQNVTEIIENQISNCIIGEYRQKEYEEKVINNEIEEELKINNLKNNTFIGLLDLRLEHALEENIGERKFDLNALKQENNKKIIEGLKIPYNAKGRIRTDKIIFSVDGFDFFDDFLLNLIDSIKKVYRENKGKNVQTSFTLSFDAVQTKDYEIIAVPILEKIGGFKYTNKIIITTQFLSRYQYLDIQRFEARTMGISRFFEKKSVNAKGEIQFETEDFDLYSLKLKNEYC